MGKIKVGSQFSGVGAFDYAIKKLGLDYVNIYQSEIDKYAREVYLTNHEEPKYYINDVYNTPIEEITDRYGSLDILMSSPPCQSFSIAGSRGGESDARGVLFYETHKFIKINNPRFFIIENVKGLLSTEKGAVFNRWKDLLGGKSINGNTNMFPNSDAVPYHIHYAVLNAKDYGIPQNRERVFIVGVRDDVDNTFKWPKTEALNKKLKDILEDEVDKKYYLSDVMIKGFLAHTQRHGKKGNGFKFEPEDENIDYIKTITARYGNASSDQYLKVKSATSKGYEIAKVGEDSINLERPESKTRRGHVGDNVAQTLTTSCNQGVAISNEDDGKIINPLKGKTQYGWHFEQGVYDENGITRTVKAGGGSGNNPKLLKDFRIRKLTPRECFRLMDFPDTFDFSVVSNTQAYKQAGNSICVGVLEKIINNLNI